MSVNRQPARWVTCLVAAAGLGVAWVPASARADQALVVGVDHYPALKQGANLAGCVNDARAVAAALKARGFQVQLLTEGEGTRKSILNAFQQAREALKPSERFVFYFAGHGARANGGGAVLLPAGAAEGSPDGDLGRDELFREMASLRAASRTVLLDSCFSGGMMRAYKGLKALRPTLRWRYYQRGAEAAVTERVNGKDLADLDDNAIPPGAADGPRPPLPVCYFTAAAGAEQAAEDNFDGVTHGVFSYYLLQALDQQPADWAAFRRLVAGPVAQRLEDCQHPLLSPGYQQQPVFDTASAAPAPPSLVRPGAATLWDEFNLARPNPRRVRLTMEPGHTPVRVRKDILSFSALVGGSGYLLILERGVRGDVHLRFPKSRNVDDARVRPGQSVRIPGGRGFYADAPGSERVKAILFTDRRRAETILSLLPSSRQLGSWRGMKDLREADVPLSDAFTSEILFEVVDE